MRIGPEVVLWGIEGVRFEGDALGVAHSNGLEEHTPTFEQVAAAASWSHAVVETRNDARINVCT